MRNAPMTKGGQPVYSEDQIEKAVNKAVKIIKVG